ncbi:MAG: serpin family protein [Saprospiraceae bacterium]
MRLLLLSLCVILFSCQKDALPVPDPVSPDDVSGIAQMTLETGWDIFRQEKQLSEEENILLSPLSIQTALLMASNGASGNTLSELMATLHCPGCPLADLNPLHKDLTTLLTQQSGQPEVTLANHFFYDANRMAVKTPFLDALQAYYTCQATDLPFANEQQSLDAINGWVYDHTHQKIDGILDRITDLDVAFLINALHFKADWAQGFAEEETVSLPFVKENGEQVTVPFVNADRNFTWIKDPEFHAVDIPFQDSTYGFTMIQPSPANKDVDWAVSLDAATYNRLVSGMVYDRAMVFFPRLKLAYDTDLIGTLTDLGVKDAFSGRDADFTAMGTSSQNIYISQIKHKAVLEVDEHGAEGAAVTSIGFAITSLPPQFRFDHPFVLVLRHIPTNTPLFIGWVNDPS